MTNTVAHLEADACEKAMVSLIADEFEKKNVSTKNISDSRKKDLMDHLSTQPILNGFDGLSKTEYFKNCAKWVSIYVSSLIEEHPNSTFNVVDVEASKRILGLKGDFDITRNDGKEISTSLKNYKGDISSIQVSSGTINSFVVKLFFESIGTGIVKSPDGEEWYTGNHEKRDQMFKKWIPSYSVILEGLHKLDTLNLEVKKEFAYSDRHEFYDEKVFDDARKRISHEGAVIIMDMLKVVDLDFLRKRILKITGMDGEEEILAISKNLYFSSLGNVRYNEFLKTVNTSELRFEFKTSKVDSSKYSGVRFFFKNERTEILSADIPTTINANGCWYEMNKPKFEGKRHKVDCGHEVELYHRQRRPYKSKQIAPSTNVWIHLNKDECGMIRYKK